MALSAPERLTFAELDQRADAACSAMLANTSIQVGQRVGLRAPNGVGYVVAVHALMRLGAVLVPISTRLSAAEVDWLLADAQVAHVLDEDQLQRLVGAPRATPRMRSFDLDAPHSVIYTSGTTGRPKGAVLTYDNHWSNALASMLNLGVQADDVWLACLPLFHVGGLAILLRSVIYGMPVVLHERFDAELVNAAIDHAGVSIVSVVSTMLERMLSARRDRPYPASLRCVLLGGGPAPLPLLERALAAGAPVMQTYGLTETASQVATLSPEDARRKIGSAGKPLFGTQVRIADDGEILVRGPVVSPAYLHHEPRGEWFSTGDLGYVDGEGYLYVHDRREDLIVTGGENVYPAEVEAVLLAHSSVAEAAVFGVPDAEWGQTVAAAIALRGPLNVEELRVFCRARLAGFKVPRRLVVLEALPRNAAGKILRRELRAAFST